MLPAEFLPSLLPQAKAGITISKELLNFLPPRGADCKVSQAFSSEVGRELQKAIPASDLLMPLWQFCYSPTSPVLYLVLRSFLHHRCRSLIHRVPSNHLRVCFLGIHLRHHQCFFCLTNIQNMLYCAKASKFNIFPTYFFHVIPVYKLYHKKMLKEQKAI